MIKFLRILGTMFLMTALTQVGFSHGAHAYSASSGDAADAGNNAWDLKTTSVFVDRSIVRIAVQTYGPMPDLSDQVWSDGAAPGKSILVRLGSSTGYWLTINRAGAIAYSPFAARDGSGPMCRGNVFGLPSDTVTVEFSTECMNYPGRIDANAVMAQIDGGQTLPLDESGATTAMTDGGYYMVAADGGVFGFGNKAPFHGSMGGRTLNAPMVGIAARIGGGYWTVASDGGIFSFGGAPFFGSMGGRPLNKPIVGMAATPSGNGYWLVASDGGIFSFGDAPFFGSMGGKPLNKAITAMASSPTGQGYWFVASDGGVFGYGDAVFRGSRGGERQIEPVVAIAPLEDGLGYRLTSRDGAVFTYSAPFAGSGVDQFRMTRTILGVKSSSVVSIISSSDFYYLISAAGELNNYGAEVWDFGDCARLGLRLNNRIVGATLGLG